MNATRSQSVKDRLRAAENAPSLARVLHEALETHVAASGKTRRQWERLAAKLFVAMESGLAGEEGLALEHLRRLGVKLHSAQSFMARELGLTLDGPSLEEVLAIGERREGARHEGK